MITGSFDNTQKTITLTQSIVVSGPFPSHEDSSGMPIGMIRTFSFSYGLPSDTVSSEGQILSISSNASLFVALGSTYGGNGYENFALPNISGRVEVGSESDQFTGLMTGESQTTLTQDQLPTTLGGSGQSVNNEQPSISVNYLIRVTSDPSSEGFVGEVDAFAGNSTAIVGGEFLSAAGQLLSISEYPQLFSIIGTTYGGNGQTTFALPDLRDRNIIGTSSTVSLGSVVGQETVSLSDANVPVSDGGQGTSFDNRSPGLALNYIICIAGVYPVSDASTGGEAVLGEIRAYAGSVSSIPQGWVLANGALLSIAQNQALFSLFGTTYGGNGSSTFALPNLSDTVIAGSGGSQSFGQTYGENNVSLEVSEVACFCKGSLIRTSKGDIPVEELQIGDEVFVYDDATLKGAMRRLTWVGQSHAVVRSRLPDDQAGYPVCLLKDAIAEGVPYKDMLITSEHCLFLNGRFVPVRMLVNGRSIFFDKSTKSYDYYHIETERHSVIMADGVMTESYLDTGNRSAFRQPGAVVSIKQSRYLTWEDAAAPLDVSRLFVEPLFHKMKNRADNVKHARQSYTQSLTSDDGLYLLTETGNILTSLRRAKDWVMFMIPEDVKNLQIMSRANRPCDVIGPFLDDRRMLGVLVGDIQLFEGHKTIAVTSHLQEADLSGWNNIEDGTMRWTDGSARLCLGSRPSGSSALMVLKIHMGGPYIVSDNETRALLSHGS